MLRLRLTAEICDTPEDIAFFLSRTVDVFKGVLIAECEVEGTVMEATYYKSHPKDILTEWERDKKLASYPQEYWDGK
jgi:hypothetical protein